MKPLSVIIPSHIVLLAVLIESVVEILTCDLSNETYVCCSCS